LIVHSFVASIPQLAGFEIGFCRARLQPCKYRFNSVDEWMGECVDVSYGSRSPALGGTVQNMCRIIVGSRKYKGVRYL